MDQTPGLVQYVLWYVLSYLLIACAALAATRLGFGRSLQSRRLGGPANGAQWRSELFHSAVSIAVYIAMTEVTAILFYRGLTRIYTRPDEYGWIWYGASYLVFLALHDTYFYWTHRWMHRPAVFRLLHRTHHASHRPTPFTAHSFHLLEATVQAAFFLGIAVAVPLHWSTFLLFYAYSSAVNVYGHLGYDLLGRHRDRGPLALFNHPSSHAWHHAHLEGNYGLYLNLWDRAMGTYRGHLSNSDK